MLYCCCCLRKQWRTKALKGVKSIGEKETLYPAGGTSKSPAEREGESEGDKGKGEGEGWLPTSLHWFKISPNE